MKMPVTIAITALSVLAFAAPAMTEALQLDFAQVAQGQWWRILTGHATHFGASHLFWDVLMFVGLGALCEVRHRRIFPVAISVMALTISLTVRLACPGIDIYRGLSGLDTGLFTWIVFDEIVLAIKRCDRSSLTLWATTSIGLMAKLLFELTTGQTLFVAEGAFQPLVESHLAGAMVGIVIGCCSGTQRMKWMHLKLARSSSNVRGI